MNRIFRPLGKEKTAWAHSRQKKGGRAATLRIAFLFWFVVLVRGWTACHLRCARVDACWRFPGWRVTWDSVESLPRNCTDGLDGGMNGRTDGRMEGYV